IQGKVSRKRKRVLKKLGAPCAWRLARTVPWGRSGSNPADLPDPFTTFLTLKPYFVKFTNLAGKEEW
ncbi:hypothetical protein, partial [Moorena sp. SIO4A5]|uniref:hypothetical protein n=1 Tax=Moorena sp. SIO4A5 TaxID=2607838 RepID=UPI0025F6FD7C